MPICTFLSPQRLTNSTTAEKMIRGDQTKSLLATTTLVGVMALAVVGIAVAASRILFAPVTGRDEGIDFADAEAASLAVAARNVRERIATARESVRGRPSDSFEVIAANEEVTRLLISLDGLVARSSESKQKRSALVQEVLSFADELKLPH
jgi:hypothetical protein